MDTLGFHQIKTGQTVPVPLQCQLSAVFPHHCGYYAQRLADDFLSEEA